MKPIMTIGQMADKPYYFSRHMKNIYSIEELCYCLMKDTYLLDNSIMEQELANWISESCDLADLGRQLTGLIRSKGTLSAFVGTILSYVGYVSEEQIRQVETAIRETANLNQYEKAKAKADYYVKMKKYNQAILSYNELMESLPKEDIKLRGSVLFNLGHAYAQLFQFQNAAKCYRLSYQTDPNEESMLSYLCAIRIMLNDKEYLDFIAEHEELYGSSQKVEQMLNRCELQFEATENYRRVSALQVFREEGSDTAGNIAPYYKELDSLTTRLKEDYREMVGVS